MRGVDQSGPITQLVGLIAPNIFATCDILVAHGDSVICGVAPFIVAPTVQRLVIPEINPILR